MFPASFQAENTANEYENSIWHIKNHLKGEY